jgi:hypothetical protein
MIKHPMSVLPAPASLKAVKDGFSIHQLPHAGGKVKPVSWSTASLPLNSCPGLSQFTAIADGSNTYGKVLYSHSGEDVM